VPNVFERLTQRSLVEAIEAQQMDALGVPEIVTGTGRPRSGAALSRHRRGDARGRRAGVRRARPRTTLAPVGEADVDATLERLRQSFAQLQPEAEGTVIAPGHVVSLQYEARIDDRVAGRADERVIEVGASPFRPRSTST